MAIKSQGKETKEKERNNNKKKLQKDSQTINTMTVRHTYQ